MDRTAVNQALEEAQQPSEGDEGGVLADVMAAQAQLELLACMERALRHRHFLPVPRALLLSSSRRTKVRCFLVVT